jgi:hypothetical protein
MNLDDLKAAWTTAQASIESLQAQQAMLQRVVHQQAANQARTRLQRAPIIELILAAIAMLALGGYLAMHVASVREHPLAALPALILLLLSAFVVVVSVAQLRLLARLDYAQSLTATQRALASVRIIRVRSTQLMLLLGLPLWICGPLVLGQWVIGYNFPFAVDRTWLLANIGFGIVAVGAFVVVAKRLRGRSPFWRNVSELAAGEDIDQANRLLGELRQFEQPS